MSAGQVRLQEIQKVAPEGLRFRVLGFCLQVHVC